MQGDEGGEGEYIFLLKRQGWCRVGEEAAAQYARWRGCDMASWPAPEAASMPASAYSPRQPAADRLPQAARERKGGRPWPVGSVSLCMSPYSSPL